MNDSTLFTQAQSPSHCGPCSLSYCLHVLGIDATQHDLAKASGLSYWMRHQVGHDEEDIRIAAAKYKAQCRFLSIQDKSKGARFAARLRQHLARGLPAILLVRNFAHWVAVLAWVEESDTFIIDDPNVRSPLFNHWSERTLLINGWNEPGEEAGEYAEPAQYFAILVSRKDRKKPRWRLTPDFLKLCEEGSGDNAVSMTRDLLEIAKRASNGASLGRGGRELARVLDDYEEVIVRNACYWVAGRHQITMADVRRQYRDYRVIAEAAGLRVPHRADHASIVAQMSSLMTTFIWNGGALGITN